LAFPRRSSNSTRSRFTLGLLLLTAVTLLALDLPGTGPLQPVRNVLAGAFRPVRSAAETVFSPVTNGWRGAFGYEEVKDENDRLRALLDEARGDEAEMARLRREVDELQKLNGVVAAGERLSTAQVISDPLSSFDLTVEIDQGSGAGVKDGMAVITGLTEGAQGGVFGRVVEVEGGRSRIELVTAASFQVGVRLEGGGRGVARGQGPGAPLRIDGIATGAEEGDFVYTSGIAETAFPPDIVVGRVAGVRTGPNDESDVLEIEPLADLDAVYVKVVLRDPPP
jgi:rod shape-determining protein MreC